MERISVLAFEFRGEDLKKGLRCEILSFALAFTRVFRPGTRLDSGLEEHKQYVGGRG